MIREMKFCIIFFLVLIPLNVVGDRAFGDISGRQVVEATWQKYRLIPHEIEKITIVMHDKGETTRKKLARWSNYDASGEDKITIKFIEPGRDKGLSLLTSRHKDRADDQWLRMPSWKRVRRVSISDESKYFAGTDLTYEDVRQLASERTQDFDYKLESENKDFWMIKASPNPQTKSGYGYRVFWIDKSFILSRIEYYSINGDLIKIQQHQNVKNCENGAWRANTIEIDNKWLDRKTEIIIDERDITSEIEEHVFTTMHLLRD